MHFIEHKKTYHIGRMLGYLLSYSVFTTLLSILLTFTHKINPPLSYFSYLYVVLFTLVIAILGGLLHWTLR